MKRLIAVLAVFLLGCAVGWRRPQIASIAAAPMQISSPSYACQSGLGGVTPVSNCAQYIVNVSRNRLGGNVAFIYQINSGPADVSAMDLTTVASGPISSTSMQAYEPSSSQTMTLNVSEP